MKLVYTVIEHGGTCFHELKTNRWGAERWEQERTAQECAEDYHSNHDGWESSWPLTFAIHAEEDGPELGRFEIDREARPVFSARRLAAEAGDRSEGEKG